MGSIIDKKSVSSFIMGFSIMFTLASIFLMNPEQMWRWLLSSEPVEKKVERGLTPPSALLQKLETENAALQNELIQLRRGIDIKEDTLNYGDRVIESNEFVFELDSCRVGTLLIGCDMLVRNKKPERELTIRNLNRTRLIDNNGYQSVLKFAQFGYTDYTQGKSAYDNVSASLIQGVPTKLIFWLARPNDLEVTNVSLKLYCRVDSTDFSVIFRNIPVIILNGGTTSPNEMSD
jgi:hypothetical protein